MKELISYSIATNFPWNKMPASVGIKYSIVLQPCELMFYSTSSEPRKTNALETTATLYEKVSYISSIFSFVSSVSRLFSRHLPGSLHFIFSALGLVLELLVGPSFHLLGFKVLRTLEARSLLDHEIQPSILFNSSRCGVQYRPFLFPLWKSRGEVFAVI